MYLRHKRPLSFSDPTGFVTADEDARTLPRNPGIGDAIGGPGVSGNGNTMTLCVLFVCGEPFGRPASGFDGHGDNRLSPWAQPNLTVYTGTFGGVAGPIDGRVNDGTPVRATPVPARPEATRSAARHVPDFAGIAGDSLVPGYYYAGLAQSSWHSGQYGWAAAYAAASLADAALVVGSFGSVSPFASTARAGVASSVKRAPQGGLVLYKWRTESATQANGWKTGDFMLFLPNLGNPRANWLQNAGRMRQQMHANRPIFDAYRDPATGRQIPTQGFLRAERNLLESRGWRYEASYGAYLPPAQ